MATFASFVSAAGVCASRGGGAVITNTGMGNQALLSNTSGYQNAAFGNQALRGNTSGRQNTAVGFCALRAETTGVCNTAIGAFASWVQNGGSNNTVVGGQAGVCITTGASNTLIGRSAGSSITTGGANTAIGFGAMQQVTTTNWNTAIGKYALWTSTGGCNTAVGLQAFPFGSGACNTAVGTSTSCAVYTANSTIAISRGGNPSNTTGHTLWGNSGVNFNWIQCRWTVVSDCRDKTCIEDLDQKLGLSFIRKLTPVSFRWDNRESYVTKCGYEYGQKDGTLASTKKAYGFEAQQMKSALEELDVEFQGLGYDTEKDAYRVTYDEVIAPLIKATQETLTRLESLEALAA